MKKVTLETPNDQTVITSLKNHRKFFVKGKEQPDFGDDSNFKFNGNEYDFFSDLLCDKIGIVFEPLEDYIEQIEAMVAVGIKPESMTLILRAIMSKAMQSLYDWERDAIKHIGQIKIIRISYNNESDELEPTTAIAVALGGDL